ncbi:MAG TPA: polysaccharide pyruvyl transferase family protein [Paraburkholderia sp.]|jgi:polysaccharide pyruvyl transferase WcaK-like protein
MKQSKQIVLLHAYSRRNSGDGLLVDLSVALLREALGERTQVSVVAADPASFPEYDDVMAAPVMGYTGRARLAEAAAVCSRWPMRSVAQLRERLQAADLVVGVGGGYLRARTRAEALKLELGHMVQMRAAKASGKPVVYLPQSIGPACAGSAAVSSAFGARLTGLLSAYSTVFVRDDRSLSLLAGTGRAERAPDLAVLEFERRHEAVLARAALRSNAVRHVALVLREAPSWDAAKRRHYAQSVQRLAGLLGSQCRLSFAVQSTGRGNDDAAYYRSLGIEAPLPGLKQLLAEDTPDVVVSVRLHGALESILHGVPAFHLSYERKGFGAYGDLHIDDWVDNAAAFDADAVMERIFRRDAISSFWYSAAGGLDAIRASRARIVATLRQAAQSD